MLADLSLESSETTLKCTEGKLMSVSANTILNALSRCWFNPTFFFHSENMLTASHVNSSLLGFHRNNSIKRFCDPYLTTRSGLKSKDYMNRTIRRWHLTSSVQTSEYIGVEKKVLLKFYGFRYFVLYFGIWGWNNFFSLAFLFWLGVCWINDMLEFVVHGFEHWTLHNYCRRNLKKRNLQSTNQQFLVTCLSGEVDWFVCLDEDSWFIGFDHDFPGLFWGKRVTSHLHLKHLHIFVLH